MFFSRRQETKAVLVLAEVLLTVMIAAGAVAQVPAGRAEILERKVICKEPGRYIGWPTITRLRSGRLVVAFSGERDEHVCPWGVTQLVWSDDEGASWSRPVTVNNTPLDDRDAGVLETSRGTLLVNWFTSLAFADSSLLSKHPGWRRHLSKIGPMTREKWLGSWVRRSTDGGKTWGPPIRTHVSAPHGPIQLRDGRLLYVGIGKVDTQKVIGVDVSADDGKTWKLLTTIQIAPGDTIDYFWEPHVVELRSGKLVAMFRYEPKQRDDCHLRQAESTDGGRTWTIAHATPIWGYPPHLLELQNGWLLVSYGRRREPFGERACLSRDGGETWDTAHEIALSSAILEGGGGDMGYPSSVQLPDGSIWTVYYEVDRPGEKPSLMGTHWRLVLPGSER